MLGADGVVLPQGIYAFGSAGIDLPLALSRCGKNWETAGAALRVLPVGRTVGVEITPLAQQPYLKQGQGHRLGTTGVLRSREYPPVSPEPGNMDLANRKVPTQNSSWTHKKRLKDSLALLVLPDTISG